MHENAKNKISGQITAGLKRCEIIDNWPQFESFEQHVDTLSSEVLKRKKEWLDVQDVYSIFYDFVSEAVEEKAGDSKLSGNLWELLDEQDARALSNRLLDYFISVPRNYEIYAPVSGSIHRAYAN